MYMCCSVVHYVAACCSIPFSAISSSDLPLRRRVWQCFAAWSSLLQRDTACCGVVPIMCALIGVAYRGFVVVKMLHTRDTWISTRCNTLQHTASHCNTLQHAATLVGTLHTIYIYICGVRWHGAKHYLHIYVCTYRHMYVCIFKYTFILGSHSARILRIIHS